MAELADTEVGDLGRAVGECAADEPRVALDQGGAAAGVLEEDRPRLTAAVFRRPRRRHDRVLDDTGVPVGWAVGRLDQRQSEPAAGDRTARRDEGDADRKSVV